MERKANFANAVVGNIDAGSVVGRGGSRKLSHYNEPLVQVPWLHENFFFQSCDLVLKYSKNLTEKRLFL